ncbi:MAG: hemolysin family protein [Bdellovibrionota bacterium]
MFEFMANDDSFGLIMIGVCLIMSAFFSSAETGITTLGTQRARYLLKTRGHSAKQLMLWVDHPGRVLSTILIFNNVVNILASAIATSLAVRHFQNQAIAVATGTITFLVLVFGEIVPKSFAKSHAEATALFSMNIIRLLEFLVRPISKILSGFADGVVNAISDEVDKPPAMSEAELEFLVNESEKAGVLGDIKKDIIEGAFEFDETRVREIMTPRTDISAVSSLSSFEDVLRLCLETGHSRIPIYKESIDEVVGVILAKDLLTEMAKTSKDLDKIKITDIMREAFFTPESKSIMEAFKDLKSTKNHLSIIIDEYGGTAGIVTMEDILEEIVGEIQDEYDAEEAKILEIGKGVYDIAGSVSISEFLVYFGIDEDEVDTKEADTLGGWLTLLVSEMPKVGQSVTAGPLKMEVTEVSRHRIERIRVTQEQLENSEPLEARHLERVEE